jgi:hypothetical protein
MEYQPNKKHREILVTVTVLTCVNAVKFGVRKQINVKFSILEETKILIVLTIKRSMKVYLNIKNNGK